MARGIAEFGPWTLAPYPDAVRALLPAVLAAARAWNFTGAEPAMFAEAEAALTRAQSTAVTEFLQANRIPAADIEVIGFHGQTVLHRAPADGRPGRTRQLGDGALMARLTGIDTVHDFRSADVAAGGQGAPLAPIYHVALLRASGAGQAAGEPGAVLNLGGVGNITSWDGKAGIVAFDTGPGNAPLNDWIRRHGAGEMDRDGLIAAAGRVEEARLQQLLAHPWLDRPFPKSLDRDDFSASMVDGLTLQDGAATLTAFTAGCVARAVGLLPVRPLRLVVCGGGRRNPTLMRMLAERTGIDIQDAEMLGWRGDAIEAECFAYLAQRCRRGLPISFPGTTGVATPATGGVLNLAGR